MEYEVRKKRKRGLALNCAGLRVIGSLFLLMGTLGTAVFQNGLIGLDQYSSAQLLEAMETSDQVMLYATIAIVLQVVSNLAIPIFAFLLAEGWHFTSDRKAYAKRVLLMALATELPYNLAVSGHWIDLNSRNPVFGILLAMVPLHFITANPGREMKAVVTKVLAVLGTCLWCMMLQVEFGITTMLLAVVFLIFRDNAVWQLMFGVAACTMQFPAPVGLLFVYFYNDEPGPKNRVAAYAFYPLMLLCMGILSVYIL